MIDTATIVTSLPCRFTSATPSGIGPRLLIHLALDALQPLVVDEHGRIVAVERRRSHQAAGVGGEPGATTCRPGALQNIACGACEC